jgi:hypothetical protein
MYIGLYVKHPLILSGFNETRIFPNFLKKYPNIKFHENPSSESQVVLRGQMDRRNGRHDEVKIRFPQSCERA